MLEQGAVRIDGERVTDRDRKIGVGDAGIFQVGKRRFANPCGLKMVLCCWNPVEKSRIFR